MVDETRTPEDVVKNISGLLDQGDLHIIEFTTRSFPIYGEVWKLLENQHKYDIKSGMSFSDDLQARHYFLHVSRRQE